MKYYSAPTISALMPEKECLFLSANIRNIPVLKPAVTSGVYITASAFIAFN